MNIDKSIPLVGGQDYKYPRIRVDKDTYDEIAYYANASNKTMNEITSALLNFGLANMEVTEERITIKKIKLNGVEI